MKIFSISLFILLINFIGGCENSLANNHLTKGPQKILAAQKQVTAVNEKQPVLHKQSATEIERQSAIQNQNKTVVIKQEVEVSPKNNLIPPKLGSEENPELAEPGQEPLVLDLSIPLNTQETATSDNSTSNIKKDYLPDLFANKKNQSKKSLQVDGKFIKREEEEIDKYRAVDGVGIDIKLAP